MRGTLAYDTQDTNTETLPTISKLGSEKNLIHEVIPIVLIFVNGFLYIITYTFQRNPYIFVISVVLPFISLFSKKPSTYRICNMVGVILVLYLFFFQYIVYFLSLLNA